MSDAPDSAAAWAAAAPDLPPFPRPEPPAPKPAPPPVEYVGFAVRATALIVDLAILGLCAMPLSLAGMAGMRAAFVVLDTPVTIATEDAMTSMFSGAWAVMALTYFTLLHRGRGQTIGKAVVGIRVRTVDLQALGTIRSLVRSFCYFFSSSFFGVGFLLAAVTPRRRAWHDFLAGTCVVHTTPEEA